MTAPEPQASAPSIDPGRWVFLSVVLDAVLIVLFTVIGRMSHGEGLGFAGVAQTAWPFLTGALLGWLVTAAWRRPLALVRTGIPVWLLTVIVGMLLRVVSGQGVAVSFVIVATVVLGVFLLGWRAIVLPIARRSGRRAARARAR
jgi:hypothetical protein